MDISQQKLLTLPKLLFRMISGVVFILIPVFLSFPAFAQNHTNFDYLSDDEKKAAQAPAISSIVVRSIWPTKEELNVLLTKALLAFAGKNNCTEPKILSVEPMKLAFLDAELSEPTFSGKIKSAWFVYADVVLCDEEGAWRFVIVQRPDDSYTAYIIFKGHTYAWLSLIRDAMTGVMVHAAIRVEKEECPYSAENFELEEMKVVKENSLGPQIFGVRYSGTWEEVWQVRACNQIFKVSLEFRADGVGGAFVEIPGDKVKAD